MPKAKGRGDGTAIEARSPRLIRRAAGAPYSTPTHPQGSTTARARKAALAFLLGYHKTQAASARAFDIAPPNIRYWIAQYKKRDQSTLRLLEAEIDLKAGILAPSPGNETATKETEPLKKGDEGFELAYKKAYKWVGLERQAKRGGSNYKLAKAARQRFNLASFHRDNVKLAAAAPGKSPEKCGTKPRFPRHFARKLIELIQEARRLKFGTFPGLILSCA